MRLSCGATLYGSQTQFYHRRRAPSASSACWAAPSRSGARARNPDALRSCRVRPCDQFDQLLSRSIRKDMFERLSVDIGSIRFDVVLHVGRVRTPVSETEQDCDADT